MAADDLPWARADGAPSGTGICLSGGGIRAASFALGVLQELQERRGLLFGPRAADHLAVVSGGSYVGATFMLNAQALAHRPAGTDAAPPLHEDSAEAKHVVRSGRSLLARGWPRTVADAAALGGLNLLAFAGLFVWTGTMLADFAFCVAWTGWSWMEPPANDDARLALAGVGIAGGTMFLRGGYADGGPKRALLPLAGLLMVVGTITSLVHALDVTTDALGTVWWEACLAGAALLGLSAIPPARLPRPIWWVIVELAVVVPRLAGFVLLGVSAAWAHGELDKGLAPEATPIDVLVAFGVFASVLALGVLLSNLSHRVSLHGFYRDALARCYAVRRQGGGVDCVAPAGTTLSSLSPDGVDASRRYPRLLVCATANVLWRSRRGRRRYAPFVYSHDRCGVPGEPAWSFDTRKLELGDVDTGVRKRGKEPLVSLMTAVASTGAAISPSMGNRTYRALRPLIAVFNLRLGRWLPNPLSRRMRSSVERQRERGYLFKGSLLGKGWDEFVPELFGLHRSDGGRVYVSDGGHYDNLGLTALLRARCADVWCVDSEADRKGSARQIETVIELSRRELDVEIDLDLEAFGARDGVLGTAHAVGTIRYRDGTQGRIVVIKLGLTAGTTPDLLRHRETDPRWPYHGTFAGGQWYPPARVDAYRRLGRQNAAAAVAAAAGP